MRFGCIIGVLFSVLVLTFPSAAVEPDEMLADPALEQRARDISQNLRCVVCQNETIDDSNATLAKDMRRLVRQRVMAGDSNEDVLAYMVERYGEFVLLRPRFTTQTLLLWFGPALLLLAGGVIALRHVRRPVANTKPELSDEDLATVNAMLQDSDRTNAP